MYVDPNDRMVYIDQDVMDSPHCTYFFPKKFEWKPYIQVVHWNRFDLTLSSTTWVDSLLILESNN